MFDGNYRSRREVNLSGGSKSGSGSSKAATVAANNNLVRSSSGKLTTLQIAKEQRELRKLQTLRHVSAKCIQKYARSYFQRRLFSNTLAQMFDLQQQPKQMSMLALRLSPNLLKFWPTTNHTNTTKSTVLHKLASTSVQEQPSTFVSTRICYAALQLLLEDNNTNTNNNYILLVQWVLCLCQQNSNTLHYLYYNSGLVSCLQRALGKTSSSTSSSTTTQYDNSNDDTNMIIAKTLLDLCFLMLHTTNTAATTTTAAEIFAAALLTTSSLYNHPLKGYIESKSGAAQQQQQLWWIHLFQCISSSLMCDDGDTNDDNDIHMITKSLVFGYELILLDNALELIWNFSQSSSNNSDVISTIIVVLIQFSLHHYPQFIYLSSWLALRHENSSLYFSVDTNNNNTKTNNNKNQEEVDDDLQSNESCSTDDDEDDDEDNNAIRGGGSITPFMHQQQSYSSINAAPAATATISNNKRTTGTATSTPSRAEFSTVKAMDGFYKRFLAKQRSTNTSSTEQHRLIKKLTHILIQGDLIAQLGTFIFSPGILTTTTARTSYSQVVYQMLSDSSGIRTNSSPLLTKLAFHCHPNFVIIKGLWNLMSNNNINKINISRNYYKIASVFCDVFSHALLPVDDDEFTNISSTIVSLDEIVPILNQELYELYWVHPVLLPFDELMDDGRFRFLLSGTKLFNSLYERWCRQQTFNKFCTEESWCWKFTVPTINDGAAANTASSVHVGDGHDYNNHDYMDEDDDEVDDDMQLDTASTDKEDAILANAFRDPKLARVLTACPQALPFIQRVQMFHSLLENDQQITQDHAAAAHQSMLMHHMRMMRDGEEEGGPHIGPRTHVRIRRDDLLGDSLRQLNTLGKKLREKVQVTLINKHGTEESGIDGGGVFKEFLDDLIREAFHPNGGGLFSVSPVETLCVNPSATTTTTSYSSSSSEHNLLKQYEFLGRVLGKAVYESILVEPQFSLAFLNLLLGKQNSLDDLKTFDPEMFKHLSSLRKMDEAVLADLGLTFEVTSQYTNRGQFVVGTTTTTSVPLLPHGEKIAVTKSNVIQYVHLIAHHKLNVEGSIQTRAFLRGFRDLIPASWVRLFSASELQKLISGDDAVKGIDVDNMKWSMQYAGGYHHSQPIIMWFWEVLAEMTAEQQRKFLKFMTSCSRQPLLGFQALIPLPCIQQIHIDETNREKLPTSATCMNLLKLPKYDSKETLREKLLYAIEAGAGFELT